MFRESQDVQITLDDRMPDEVLMEFLRCGALNFQYALHTTQEETQPLSESSLRRIMESVVHDVVHKSENTVLEELDKVQINPGKRIEKVEKNLDELNQYYRITKLKNDKKTA